MTTMPLLALRAHWLDRLTEVLRLMNLVREMGDITSPEGLRKAIQLVLELATRIGLDQKFIERLKTILGNDTEFQIVLVIVRYLSGLLHHTSEPADARLRFTSLDGNSHMDVTARGFLDWLPTVLQILDLIRRVLEALQPRT